MDKDKSIKDLQKQIEALTSENAKLKTQKQTLQKAAKEGVAAAAILQKPGFKGGRMLAGRLFSDYIHFDDEGRPYVMDAHGIAYPDISSALERIGKGNPETKRFFGDSGEPSGSGSGGNPKTNPTTGNVNPSGKQPERFSRSEWHKKITSANREEKRELARKVQEGEVEIA